MDVLLAMAVPAWPWLLTQTPGQKHVLRPVLGTQQEVRVHEESQIASKLRQDRQHSHLAVPFLAGVVKKRCTLPLAIRLLNQQTPGNWSFPRNLILGEGTG